MVKRKFSGANSVSAVGNNRLPMLLVLALCVLLSACRAPGAQAPEETRLVPAAPVEWPADTIGLDHLQFAPRQAGLTAQTGFACHPQSEAPAVPAHVQNLWDRVRSGFALDSKVSNPHIDAQIRLYSNRQELLKRANERARLYMFYIVEQLESRDLPLELALLPIVESAYDPFAYSHGRASGLWQFIPGTGRRFGLKQNWWYDGRRDVVDSTQAAMDYLQYLYDYFDGDWLLALAAYNSGEGNVAKAIKSNRLRGRKTDFWSLKLPRETRAFVPKLIALARIVQQPDAYGIDLPEINNARYFDIAEFDGQIDLAQAADLAAIDMETLYRLNPGFNRWATDPSGPLRLILPVEAVEPFKTALAALPDKFRIAWEVYRIRRGDTLIGIARRNHTTPTALSSVNNLSSHLIRAGDTLLIPSASRSPAHYSMSAPQRVAQQQSRDVKGARRNEYVVRSGDSLWTISRRYQVSTRQLARWNGMGLRDTLSIGRKLVVWEPGDADVRTAPAQDTRQDLVRRIGYRVRNGDSLWRIANRFRVRIDDITRWNKIDVADVLRPGQALTLYVDIRSTR